MTSTAIGLGSNTGDSFSILDGALAALKRLGDLSVSRRYRSAPLHRTDQPTYVNQVVSLAWNGGALQLLDHLMRIESLYGRNRLRETRYGPRTLDLDLLLFDHLLIRACDLTVPHPRIGERAFVLEPLLELQPNGVHPATGISWRIYRENCRDQALFPVPGPPLP